MNRKIPLILTAVFVLIIVFGVLGITRMNREDAAGGAGAEAVDAPRGNSSSTAVDGSESGSQRTDGVPGEAMLSVGMPASLPSQIKEYTGFVVSFNAENRTPNWVAWELLGAETDGPMKRENKFWQDPEVRNCPEHRDYTKSGYDRGHMCPAADMKWSAEAMHDCFSLANIVPQDNSLNTGAWSTLENKERVWAKRDSAILIIAGPIYQDSDRTRIGQAGVRVPSAFFKVLAAPFAREPRGIAFVYPNMTAPGNMQNYVMTIRDVEKMTGYDFFNTLPADLQDQLETRSSFRDWNKN